MEALVERFRREHSWAPPLPETEDLLRQFETSQGFKLPEDVKVFYRQYGGAELFQGDYRILAIPELCHRGLAQAGEDFADWFPSWYVFCDTRDGDYVGFDLASTDGTRVDILRCDHEQFEYTVIIARSFTEFLVRALDSGGESFWFDEGFESYGVLEYEPPPSFWRRVDAEWWASLGPEVGPEPCTSAGCSRQRLQGSVKCRRHHYERVKGQDCPFDD